MEANALVNYSLNTNYEYSQFEDEDPGTEPTEFQNVRSLKITKLILVLRWGGH
jgi:hypothetical protein